MKLSEIIATGSWASVVEPNRSLLLQHESTAPLVSVYSFVIDVEEGAGIIGYFLNSSGDYFDEIRNLFAAIGSSILIQYFEELASEFPKGDVPRDRDARIDAVNLISNEMDSDPFRKYEVEYPQIRKLIDSVLGNWMLGHESLLESVLQQNQQD